MDMESFAAYAAQGKKVLAKKKKDELVDDILALANNDSSCSGEVALHRKLDTMTQLLVQIQKEVQTVKEENKSLRRDVENLTATVTSQQRYLEQLDSRERACNLIVLGITEDGTPDQEKVGDLFDELECSQEAGSFTVQRLKKKNAPAGNTPPPLLVKLKSSQARKTILNNREKIDDQGNYSGVKMKRDQHPAIRREWGRLHDVFRAEQSKPENTGRDIIFDRQNRKIVDKNGEIIDMWQPNFS